MVEEALHLDIFRVNEEKANRYTAFCTFIAAVVAVLMWVLNLCVFFIVDQHLMNVAMPAGVALFLLPSLLVRIGNGDTRLLKYAMMCCFMIGIAILISALTIKLVLAWSCPVIFSCHGV